MQRWFGGREHRWFRRWRHDRRRDESAGPGSDRRVRRRAQPGAQRPADAAALARAAAGELGRRPRRRGLQLRDPLPGDRTGCSATTRTGRRLPGAGRQRLRRREHLRHQRQRDARGRDGVMDERSVELRLQQRHHRQRGPLHADRLAGERANRLRDRRLPGAHVPQYGDLRLCPGRKHLGEKPY